MPHLKVCRFCLAYIENYNHISNNIRQNIETLCQVNFFSKDLHTSVSDPKLTKYVICDYCVTYLEKSVKLLTTYKETMTAICGAIQSLPCKIIKIEWLPEFKDISESNTVCCICFQIVNVSSVVYLYKCSKNLLPHKFAKKMLSYCTFVLYRQIMDPKMCLDCWTSLQEVYSFKKSYDETESSIKHFRENSNIKGYVTTEELYEIVHGHCDSNRKVNCDSSSTISIQESNGDVNSIDASNDYLEETTQDHLVLENEQKANKKVKMWLDSIKNDASVKTVIRFRKVKDRTIKNTNKVKRKTALHYIRREKDIYNLQEYLEDDVREVLKRQTLKMNTQKVKKLTGCKWLPPKTKRYCRRKRKSLFSCPYCSYTSISDFGVYRHMLAHKIGSIVLHKCKICDYKITCKTALKKHINTHHVMQKSTSRFATHENTNLLQFHGKKTSLCQPESIIKHENNTPIETGNHLGCTDLALNGKTTHTEYVLDEPNCNSDYDSDETFVDEVDICRNMFVPLLTKPTTFDDEDDASRDFLYEYIQQTNEKSGDAKKGITQERKTAHLENNTQVLMVSLNNILEEHENAVKQVGEDKFAMKNVNRKRLLKCEEVDKEYHPSLNKLTKFKNNKNNKLNKEEAPGIRQEKLYYVCNFCLLKFTSLTVFAIHVKLHKEDDNVNIAEINERNVTKKPLRNRVTRHEVSSSSMQTRNTSPGDSNDKDDFWNLEDQTWYSSDDDNHDVTNAGEEVTPNAFDESTKEELNLELSTKSLNTAGTSLKSGNNRNVDIKLLRNGKVRAQSDTAPNHKNIAHVPILENLRTKLRKILECGEGSHLNVPRNITRKVQENHCTPLTKDDSCISSDDLEQDIKLHKAKPNKNIRGFKLNKTVELEKTTANEPVVKPGVVNSKSTSEKEKSRENTRKILGCTPDILNSVPAQPNSAKHQNGQRKLKSLNSTVNDTRGESNKSCEAEETSNFPESNIEPVVRSNIANGSSLKFDDNTNVNKRKLKNVRRGSADGGSLKHDDIKTTSKMALRSSRRIMWNSPAREMLHDGYVDCKKDQNDSVNKKDNSKTLKDAGSYHSVDGNRGECNISRKEEKTSKFGKKNIVSNIQSISIVDDSSNSISATGSSLKPDESRSINKMTLRRLRSFNRDTCCLPTSEELRNNVRVEYKDARNNTNHAIFPDVRKGLHEEEDNVEITIQNVSLEDPLKLNSANSSSNTKIINKMALRSFKRVPRSLPTKQDIHHGISVDFGDGLIENPIAKGLIENPITNRKKSSNKETSSERVNRNDNNNTETSSESDDVIFDCEFIKGGQLSHRPSGFINRRMLQCKLCFYTTCSKNVMKTHTIAHENNKLKIFQCTQCSYKITNFDIFGEHLKTHPSLDISDSEDERREVSSKKNDTVRNSAAHDSCNAGESTINSITIDEEVHNDIPNIEILDEDFEIDHNNVVDIINEHRELIGVTEKEIGRNSSQVVTADIVNTDPNENADFIHDEDMEFSGGDLVSQVIENLVVGKSIPASETAVCTNTNTIEEERQVVHDNCVKLCSLQKEQHKEVIGNLIDDQPPVLVDANSEETCVIPKEEERQVVHDNGVKLCSLQKEQHKEVIGNLVDDHPPELVDANSEEPFLIPKEEPPQLEPQTTHNNINFQIEKVWTVTNENSIDNECQSINSEIRLDWDASGCSNLCYRKLALSNVVICGLCNTAFMNKGDKLWHQQLTHYDTRYPYKCHFCSDALTEHEYMYHMNMKHGGIKFKCATCNKFFVNSYFVRKHVLSHQGFKTKFCKYCIKKDLSTEHALRLNREIEKNDVIKANLDLGINHLRFKPKSELSMHSSTERNYSKKDAYPRQTSGVNRSTCGIKLASHSSNVKPIQKPVIIRQIKPISVDFRVNSVKSSTILKALPTYFSQGKRYLVVNSRNLKPLDSDKNHSLVLN